MSDPYGYGAARATIANNLGISLSHAENTYTDAVIRQIRIDGEKEGLDITAEWMLENVLQVCASCNGPTHLKSDEIATAAAVFNEVNYVIPGATFGRLLGRRASATEGQIATVYDALAAYGDVNLERCTAARLMEATA